MAGRRLVGFGKGDDMTFLRCTCKSSHIGITIIFTIIIIIFCRKTVALIVFVWMFDCWQKSGTVCSFFRIWTRRRAPRVELTIFILVLCV